jgi:5'-nucleotidase
MTSNSKNSSLTGKTHQIALFDMDGTLADYDGRMSRDLRRIKERGEPDYSPHDHKAPKFFGTRLDLIKGQSGWWLKLPKLKLGFDLLRAATDLGFQVQILTMGPHNTPSAWMEKVLWCHKHVGKSVKVTVTDDKSLVYGKILVDDTPDYLETWLERHPRGWGIAPAQLANENFHHPRVIRYDGTNLDAVRKMMRSVLD